MNIPSIQRIFSLSKIFRRSTSAATLTNNGAKRYSSCIQEEECGPCAKKVYMDPKCKIGLVTGGTSGIGFALADQLLCNGAQRVVVTGRNPCKGEKAVEQLNGRYGKDKAFFVQMDVNCDKQFEDVFKEMTDKFGGVDILCNNAGIFDEKNWRKQINTNLAAMVLGVKLGMKYMSKQSHGGLIVNTASTMGLQPFAYGPVYVATKHGVVGLSRSYGDDYHYNKTKTRVVGLCPGVTDTGDGKKSISGVDKEVAEKAAQAIMALPKQNTTSVGNGFIYLVKYAKPGSCWVVEGGQLLRVDFPDLKLITETITYV